MDSVERATTIEAVLAIHGLGERMQVVVYGDQHWRSGPRPDHTRDRSVVGDAIHPRAQRAATVIASQASPQRDVNVLQQVASRIRIAFVAASQSLERGPERARHLRVAEGDLGVVILHSHQIVATRPTI